MLARDYSLPYAKISYTVRSDGTVQISERIRFRFRGAFHWVGRYVEFPKGIHLKDIRVGVIGAPAVLTGRRVGNGFYIKASFKRAVVNRDITLVVFYTLTKAVQVFNDTAQLFPSVWGSSWKKKMQKLDVLFELPDKASEIKYYVHPSAYLVGKNVNGNRISFVFRNISAGVPVEIRLLMPRRWFADSPNATFIPRDALPYISKVEMGYQHKKIWLNLTGYLLAIIALLIPVLIYIFFGREPRISYRGIYERDIPYPDPPAKVNAIIMGKVGVPTREGLLATVMNLVRLKILSLRAESEDQVYLSVISKEPSSKLEPYETFVLEKIKDISDGKEVLWKDFASAFSTLFKVWVDMVRESIDIEKFFYPRGNVLLKSFGWIAVISSAIAFYLAAFFYHIAFYYPDASKVFYIGLLALFISGIISLVLPDKVAGRWTRYGLTYYRRWLNFRAFLTDFSRLKEYPPSSIVVWESYLVYATALGVAREVIKNMKLILPEHFDESELSASPFYIWYMNPLWMESGWHSALSEGLGNIDIGDFDSFGDIGGGFGGGGGDAG